LTSFTDPINGLRYQWTCAPFGLANSVSALVMTVMSCLSSLISRCLCYVYVDDVAQCSKSWEECLSSTEELLHTLQFNGLSVNPKKTVLAMPKIKFLGCEVSKDGITLSDDKVRILHALKKNFPKDKNLCKGIWACFNSFANTSLRFHKIHTICVNC
jgi:hypothetical protein